MSKQTRLASLAEAFANTALGFVISFGVQKTLNYAYDVQMSNEIALWFVVWFTVASVARSYLLRRLWEMEWWKKVRRIWKRRTGVSSTKACPECSSTFLVLLRTQNKKVCSQCNTIIHWTLESGQKPLL